MASPSLTVVGLDAATFDVIDPLLERGDLPHLARLLAGSRGPLRSTTHPLTTQAWSTMVTGVNAGRHGLWDFVERGADGYDLVPVNGSFRRAPALWDRLRAAGRRVGVMNVPFTWPAPEVDGFALAGFDAAAREDGMSWPRDLMADLRRQFGEPVLDHRFPIDSSGRADLDLVRRAAEQKVAVAAYLSDRFDPELLWVVFMAADHIHHLCWPEWDERGPESRVAEVYRILDEATGALVAIAGGEDVMVVSDHGGGSLSGVVNLNAWLAREGLLTYTGGADRVDARHLRRTALNHADRLRRKLPPGLRNAVKQRMPGLRERSYALRRGRGVSVIDWSQTRAFSYGTFGNVVINVRGRESQGIVEPGADYERARDEVIERALDLRDPAGERIVTAAHRREELCDGPFIDKVPDVVIEFTDYAWLGKGNMTERADDIWDAISIGLDLEESYVGSHRPDGIVALSGPSALEGGEIVSARIEDVAPTVLYLLGEPIPVELEGRLLVEAIEPDVLDERPPDYREGEEVEVAAAQRYDAGETDEVRDRLRGLGYIE